MHKYILFLVFPLLFNCSTAVKKTDIYNVYDYGAKGDGITNDQKAIQKAIDACKGTGGTVLFSSGTFLTGQLMLGSDMVLKVDSSATLLGIQSDSESDYLHHKIETRFQIECCRIVNGG